ncbi:MAG: phenylacetate-CoA oxygenase subunit PaaC [Xylophilus ampelinus]
MQASLTLDPAPDAQYLLRTGDTCLVLAQRLAEWCGHAPVLEEDIALANMALDLLGQARALLTRAGRSGGPGQPAHDEDQLAFLRDERDFRNLTIAELPRGDFAVTVLRNAMVATLLRQLWHRLRDSSDAEVAAIAAKAVKEARYHQRHAADWVLRLADGTDESRRRMEAALRRLWPYRHEMFEAGDPVDEAAAASGLGPRWSELREPWHADMGALLAEAGLEPPADTPFRSTGRHGRHSEHLGPLLAEMQSLQRAHPGGVW